MFLAWAGGASLAERFAQIYQTLAGLFPTQRRPGRTYQGLVKALDRQHAVLLPAVQAHLRALLPTLAPAVWRSAGWAVFAGDGSKVELPRTPGHEQASGSAGKSGSGPQRYLTWLMHMGLNTLWDWRQGPARSSERAHLAQMLAALPVEQCLLLLDAGFPGYDLLTQIVASGRHVLVRVGANVRLLTQLGYAYQEHAGIVYLWPQDQQGRGRPPLVLRLLVVEGGRTPVYLLTDVLDQAVLGDAQAGAFYRLRWGVEVAYRHFKRTLGQHKLASRAARPAELELDWAVVGFWLLSMLGIQALVAAGQAPTRLSVARARTVLRDALARPRGRGAAYSLGRRLSRAVRDAYQRKGPKATRLWPRKKREAPPGAPRLRPATAREVQLAQRLKALTLVT